MSVAESFREHLVLKRPALVVPGLFVERARLREGHGTHTGLFFAGPGAETVARAFIAWATPATCAEQGAQYSLGSRPEAYTRVGTTNPVYVEHPDQFHTGPRLEGFAVTYAYYPDADSF